jgi:hypothetical protein
MGNQTRESGAEVISSVSTPRRAAQKKAVAAKGEGLGLTVLCGAARADIPLDVVPVPPHIA